jgi:hypothetical protein
VSERGAVPWVDQPGQLFEPSPLPVHYRPENAPPCTAAQVQASPGRPNGAAGYLVWSITFRNVSTTTCVLRGYPSAVASEPGQPDVTGTHKDRWFGGFATHERSGNMRPGGITGLLLVTTDNCPAGQAHPNSQRIYHAVTVGIPGGGQVILNGAFDVTCGLFTGPFAVHQPAQRYTHSPLSGARVTLDLPSGAVAGTTMDYVAALTNPTGADMVLSPCPGYLQRIGPAKAAVLSLNCRAQPRIPAHQTVRFAMRLRVPAGTPTGPAELYWETGTPGGPFASGPVHVYGRDTPCRAAQLRASVAAPSPAPLPSTNVMILKKMATEVLLTVTNVSGRACSVYGVPAVAVRAADGSDLSLRQVPDNFGMPPVLPLETAITLAPHTGTARTALYWFLPWCGPAPNPVTLTITFPANGAVITVAPAGGWTPPRCRHLFAGAQVSPGEVSADPFRLAAPPRS